MGRKKKKELKEIIKAQAWHISRIIEQFNQANKQVSSDRQTIANLRHQLELRKETKIKAGYGEKEVPVLEQEVKKLKAELYAVCCLPEHEASKRIVAEQLKMRQQDLEEFVDLKPLHERIKDKL